MRATDSRRAWMTICRWCRRRRRWRRRRAGWCETLYQYNQSKLTLARNTGVVETQYKVYLGR